MLNIQGKKDVFLIIKSMTYEDEFLLREKESNFILI